ncbi:MAG TPA: cytochrome c [Puia sp.]|nr:cytochrome c [Puia sp.]
MRILRSVFLCLLAALASCHAPINPDNIVGADHLPSTLFMIDPTRDTTLTTPKGAILKIPRGAFDADSGTVQLEVKEAYSVEDMLRARLLTRGKGVALSSGGMIYINLPGGVSATLRKPIAVSIPTPNLQEGMRRYRGVKNGQDDIDWVDPSPLDSNPATKRLLAGRALFQTNCASCHALKSRVIGPGLAYITSRRPYDWLVRFTRDNMKVLASNDEFACWLYNRYDKTPMNVYPTLSDEEMTLLYGYITNASRQFDSSSIKDDKLSFDSCRQYRELIDSLQVIKDSLQGKRNRLIQANGLQIVRRWYDQAGNRDTGSHVLYVSSAPVTVLPHDPVYYQFQVDSFGWYNVDMPVSELAGVVESDLKVLARGELGTEANVFLIIPARKIIQQGGLLTGAKDEYGFLTGDGKIPLPQGLEAYIVAMGEHEGKVIFGKAKFITSPSQSLPLELSLVSKEEFNRAIDELQLDGLDIRAHDSPHAAEIRSADSVLAALAKLVPANCDCHCRKLDSVFREDSAGK